MFPDDTDSKQINKFIEEWTMNSKEDIVEIYPIGSIGERGAARFRTEERMWTFMANNKGQLTYSALGKQNC